MMWLFPAAVAVLAIAPILLLARRVASEAIGLRREMSAFSDLRPALLTLRDDARTLRRGVAVRVDQLPRR